MPTGKALGVIIPDHQGSEGGWDSVNPGRVKRVHGLSKGFLCYYLFCYPFRKSRLISKYELKDRCSFFSWQYIHCLHMCTHMYLLHFTTAVIGSDIERVCKTEAWPLRSSSHKPHHCASLPSPSLPEVLTCQGQTRCLSSSVAVACLPACLTFFSPPSLPLSLPWQVFAV